MNINLLDYLDHTARKLPDKTAFVHGSDHVTFGELAAETDVIGTAIAEVAKIGQPILILGEKSIDIIRLYLGVLKAGCYYLPVDQDIPESRMKAIIEKADAKLVLTDNSSKALMEKFGSEQEVYSISELSNGSANPEILLERRNATIDTDPAYVIFTSGSTGSPKGVVGSHRALIDYIDAITDSFDMGESDILGNQSPLDYIAAVRDIYLPLKNGSCTHLMDKQYFAMPAKLFAYLNENRIDTICWVAPALSLCAELSAFKEDTPKYLKKIVFTGSVLPCKHLRAWQDHVPDAVYINQYGPTEVTASCTYYIVRDPVDPEDSLPIGIPFRNTGIILLDGDKVVPSGGKGEICVRGTCLSLGYYKDAERTKQSFVVNPANTITEELIYRTGDIGGYDANGVLRFYGRTDNQIKHMGHRVELSEIEIAAANMDGVNECVCLYREDKKQIYLFYTGTALAKDIAVKLRSVLPGFMVPRKFISVDEIPILPNGKYNVHKLKELMV